MSYSTTNDAAENAALSAILFMFGTLDSLSSHVHICSVGQNPRLEKPWDEQVTIFPISTILFFN